jgi:dTDP-4-dehydrorhamnose 3,5-epimerase
MLEGFQRSETKISGCLRINPCVRRDERGAFVKILHPEAYPLPDGNFAPAEEFYSVSKQRVLRGLHFQRPPAEAARLIHCVAGRILDVVVDLRVGSPTFGRHETFELCGDRADMLYVPVGLAHGFYVVSPEAVVLYKSTRVYSPEHDTGIHWASAGISWPDRKPILSDRDRQFMRLSELKSPFHYPNQGQVLFARYRIPSRLIPRNSLTPDTVTQNGSSNRDL